MPSLAKIREGLGAHRPKEVPDDGGYGRAAVAMLLRERDGVQVLLIERAERKGDPWSGHMAFPGGRVESDDPHVQGAAERETFEEVGVSLADVDPLGRLDDLQGRRASGQSGLVISAFVYHLVGDPVLALNDEVQDAFWFPLAELRAPRRHVDFQVRQIPGIYFPGIRVGSPELHVVWGLTYRFLAHFFQVVGKPLPPPHT